jgi:hypothetical protein
MLWGITNYVDDDDDDGDDDELDKEHSEKEAKGHA